ncbi:MAG: antitoxin MazE family protein [Mariprofundaceae bacterium]|nr:antitoxin MazE family protein [Mariprofundaceae bacterium]
MSSAARVQKHREHLRESGLRPIQIWVPDTRKEGFADEAKRQCLLCDKADLKDKGLDAFMDEALQDIEGWE